MSFDLAEAQRLGDLLFGRGLRLRVALWIYEHDDPLHFQGAVAQSVEAPSTEVGKELDRLTELGMLQRLPRMRKNDRKNYMKIDSELWNIIREARMALEAAHQGGQ